MKHNPAQIDGMDWPIFMAFPKLAKVMQPVHICDLPSPVEPLKNLSKCAWIKRDDAIHPVYGGNKIRKFEFIASEIRDQQASHVYTFGGTGTNHGVATAVICQQLGVKASVITFDQPESNHVKQNQKAMKKFGSRVMNAGSIYWALAKFYLNPKRLNPRYYFLPAGGAAPIATFAYINAAFELKQQIARGDCPEPCEIYVAVGSSSTLAGLTLGCQLAGLKTKVIGIQVFNAHIGPIETCTESVSQKMMSQALAVIRREYPNVPKELPPVYLDTRYFNPGYGVLTESTQRAIDKGETLGVKLEHTYSGKAFDAFLKACEQAHQPILFWQTYNSQTL